MTGVELVGIKVVFALAVLAVGVAGALSPWALGARTRGRTLDLGNTFAGGVLAGAGLLHMLPAAATDLGATLPRVEYPLAFLLAAVGFFLILFVEGVLAAGHHDVPHSDADTTVVQHEIGRTMTPARTAAPVLLLVLSGHSLISGLALGAQGTLGGALGVFLAVIVHKGVAGFALGITYRRNGVTLARAASRMAVFASMTPLGILIGDATGAALTTRGAELFEAAFTGLGAGTFIYIAAIDIIRTEFDDPRYRGAKWGAASAGFAVMAVLAVWI